MDYPVVGIDVDAPGVSLPWIDYHASPLWAATLKAGVQVLDPLRDAENHPSDVLDTCERSTPCTPQVAQGHVDLNILTVAGAANSPLVFRVAQGWGEQGHVFGVEGHRWALEPGMSGAEQVDAHVVVPGYGFNAFMRGGFGGDFGKTGDYVFGDRVGGFFDAGLWGILRVEPDGPKP